jgi:hypothetical protein
MGSKVQHGDYSNLLTALRERIPCCVAASYFVRHGIALTVEGYEDLVAVGECYPGGRLPLHELDSYEQEIHALLTELGKRGWDGKSGLEGVELYPCYRQADVA